MYTPITESPDRKNTGYIPIAHRRRVKNPTDNSRALYFADNPTTRIGSMSQSTRAYFQPGESTPNEQVVTLARTMGQGIARAWAATGSRLASDIGTAKSDVVDPQTFFGNSLVAEAFGETIFGRSEPFNATSEDKEFLEVFGTDPEVAAGTGGSLTMLLSALDLTGAGGAPKGLASAIRAVKATKKAEEALTLARNLGLADDIAEQYADIFVRAKTTQEAKDALESSAKLQDTTRRSYRPISERGRGEYPTVHQGGELKMVKGEPVEIVEGVDTFLHKGDGGWVVSELSTGRFLSESVSKEGAIAKARFNVDSVGVDKFLDLIKSNRIEIGKIGRGIQKLGREFEDIKSQTSRKSFDSLAQEARKFDTAEEFVDAQPKVFRGTGGKVDPNMIRTRLGSGRYFSKSQDTAKQFGQVEEATLSDLNIRKMSFTEYEDLVQPTFLKLRDAPDSTFDGSFNSAQKIMEKAKEVTNQQLVRQGVDGIETTIAGESVIAVFPKSISKIKTKSQLTDIFNKVKSTKAIPESKVTAKTIEKPKAVSTLEKKVSSRDTIITKLRNARETSQETKKEIVEYVKQNLDPKDRGKALVMVRDAKTPNDLNKAFARINRWAEDVTRKEIRNEILAIQKKIMDSPSVAVDYKAKIKELMGDFELKGHRESTLERLKKTREFLESEAQKGKNIEVPRRLLRSLELLNRTPFDEVTLNQLEGLKAEIELLEDLGRTKFRTIENVWEAHKGKIFREIEAQSAPPVTRIEAMRPAIGERLTTTQKFKNMLFGVMNQAARIDKAITPMDAIFDLLDGGKGLYNGANFRFFKGQVDAGYGRYITRKDVLQNPIVDLVNTYKLKEGNFERMGVVAAREQDGGLEKLVASGFTEQEINAVKLTKQEQEVLDVMRETFDSQFPELQDTMRRVYNQPVEKVKNYFSFMTDWKAMDESEVFQRFGSQQPEQYGAPRKNVEAGFTKSRVGGDQKIKINAMDVFLQHTDNTSYLLELGETSKMLGEIAASPRYAELVGEHGQLMVREWIDVISRKGGAAGSQEIALLNTLRRNVGAGILGLKLSTVAIQPTALVDGMGFIGAKYGVKGATNFASSKQWREFIVNMPEIKDRMGGEFALRELTDDNWLQKVQRKGFIPLQTLDQLTAGSVAAGAYERKMIELGREIDLTKGYDAEALAYAQLAVRRTQSSGNFKDVPLAVSRGAMTGNRSLDRAILQFQNFLLTRWSRVRHDAFRAGVNTRNVKPAIPVFTAILAASAVGAGIRIGVNKIQDFITGKEDEDSVQEDLNRYFMYEVSGTVPFLGTAVSMAMYDGEMFPILDAPKGVISGLNRVITSESESAKLRGLTEFAGSVGAMFGIPGSAQTEQLIRGSIKDTKKSESPNKRIKAPSGLPGLPSLKNNLPAPSGLPALP